MILPDYDKPCLIKLSHYGWVEGVLSLETDTEDMYYPHSPNNSIKYEVWYCEITDSFYELGEVVRWIYLDTIQELK